MGGGSHHAPTFTVSWPTGEFGGMGLEGAVKLGMRKELLAERDLTVRRALFDDLVAKAYDSGKALQCARARALPHANFFFLFQASRNEYGKFKLNHSTRLHVLA